MRKFLAVLILFVPALGVAIAMVCGFFYVFAGITLMGSPEIYIMGFAVFLVTATLVPVAASVLDL